MKKENLLIETYGGRKSSAQNVSDCVTRAISIAFDKEYKDVYTKLYDRAKHYAKYGKSSLATYLRQNPRKQSPRNVGYPKVYEYWIKKFGFVRVDIQSRNINWDFDTKFIKSIANGTYIFDIRKGNSGHLVTVKANKVFDSWVCFDCGYKVIRMYCSQETVETLLESKIK